MTDSIFRIITILIMLSGVWYWRVQGKIADREKPKTTVSLSVSKYISKYIFLSCELLVFLQVLGLPLITFSEVSWSASFVGMMLVIIGAWVCFVARRELSSNWANGYEYQIKKKHELITSGIYRYIRHPIYSGIACVVIGGELVAQSYLWLSALAIIAAFYFQGKREEKILLEHFGTAYKTYMKKTKMLIPFIF